MQTEINVNQFLDWGQNQEESPLGCPHPIYTKGACLGGSSRKERGDHGGVVLVELRSPGLWRSGHILN